MHQPDRVIDWAAVRHALDAGELSRVAICRRFGISRGELERRVRDNRWNIPARDDSGDLDIWLDGFFAVLERVLHQMETMEMIDPARETAALDRLARTLDNLLGLRERGGSRTEDERETREMQELRKKIARRINELDAG